MIARTSHLLLRLLAGVIAGAVVMVLLLALRLERGPLSMDFLAPMMARALGGNGVAVTIDHASLALDAGPKLEVLAHGVHLARAGDGTSLMLPALAIDLSPRALLGGVIAPSRIVITDPVLRLERDAAGSFHLGFGGDEAAISDAVAQQLIHDLSQPLTPTVPLGALTDIVVQRARLIVDDRALGVVWHADDLDLHVHRDADGLSGTLRLAVALGGATTQLDGLVAYRRADDRITARLDFTGLRLSTWAAAAPALAPLAALDVPLTGTLRATLDPTRFSITDAAATIVLGAGALRHAALPGGAVTIAGGMLTASYDPGAGRIALDRVALDLGGPRVSLSGTIDGVGASLLAGALPSALDISAAIEAHGLPVDEFPRWWPETVGPITRRWVVGHIHAGVLDTLAAQLNGHLDLAAGVPHPFTVARLTGTLAYHGLSVDYFTPLPPAHDVGGTATFDRAALVFTPTSGALMGVRATRAQIRLYQLDTNDEQVAIDLTLRGPLKDALDVLDRDPLHYARAVSIDPSRVSGDFDATVTFAFPLVHTLEFSQVTYGVDGTIAAASVGDALLGRDLVDGQFKLRLDRAALRLDGTATLAGVPVALTWTQNLDSGDAVRSRYTLHGALDDAARRALDLDLVPGVISGPVGFAVDYTLSPARTAAAAVTLDLGAARLDLAKLGWSKPAGTPATAQIALAFADDRLTAMPRASVEGGGMDALLAAQFSPAGAETRLDRLEVRRLVVGKTNVTGSLARRAAGGWQLQISGASFDAAGLVAAARSAPAPGESEPPLVITAKLDHLVLGAGREVRAVSGELYSDGVHWQAASIDATMNGGGALRLRFGTVAGDRKFSLSTDDLGALLHLIDLTDNIRGGRSRLDGTVVDDGARRALKGTLDGSDYRLVGAPLFARLLSVASFSGIASLLRGEGIPFSRLSGDVTYTGDAVTVANLRAYGGAIGVNASGSVDNAAQTIDVSGTLVPAYLLNSVLGNIPILGNLLLGGEGEGIFAANFRVAGPLADPGVSVNPLSALAPGVLRKLFLFNPSNPAPAPAADPGAKP